MKSTKKAVRTCVLKLRASNIWRNIEQTDKLFQNNDRRHFKSKGCSVRDAIKVGDQEVVVEELAMFCSELSSSHIDSDTSVARISEAHIRSYYPAAIDLLSDDIS